MSQPEVEFFSEDIEGVDYLNVGFKFTTPDGNVQHCVLGAFTGGLEQDGMTIIKGLVEQAGVFMQEAYLEMPTLEEVPELVIIGGGAGVEG